MRTKIARSKNPAPLISNHGYQRFLRIRGEAEVVIEEEKLTATARWDGLHGVITSAAEIPVREVINRTSPVDQRCGSRTTALTPVPDPDSHSTLVGCLEKRPSLVSSLPQSVPGGAVRITGWIR